MSGSRLSLTALLCVLVCLLAGCTGILADDVTEEELLSEFEDVDPPEGMSATVESNVTFENETIDLAYDAWYRLSGEIRTEGTLDGQRIVEVDDGEQMWSYNANESIVRVRESPDTTSTIVGTINATEEVIRSRNATEIRKTEYEGREAYHVVFDGTETAGRDSGPLPPLLPGTEGVISSETAGVDGNRSTENITVFQSERVELWIDAEYMFILRQKVEGENAFEMRYSDVEFEPGLDDDRFEFEVPDEATVEQMDTPEYEEFDSREAVREAAPFGVVEPAFERDDYEFDTGFVITYEDGDEAEVGLQYDTGTEFPLTVTKRNRPVNRSGEAVSVGGHAGRYEALDGSLHRLTWEVDGFDYSVLADTEIDRQTLVRLAESMDTG